MVFCGGDFAFRSADHSVCMFDRRNLTSDGVGSLLFTNLKNTKLLFHASSGVQTSLLSLGAQ
ncbi:hypothetical protein Hdeb2414_s0006g00195341 [Helianthus debilis subsp. tardiflorus]